MHGVPPALARTAAACLLLSACSTGTPLVLARHVPQAVHRVLAQRAAARGIPPYPSDVVSRHDRPCARTPLRAGWVARENALPGTSAWQVTQGGPVQLYVEQPSLACGDVLDLRLGGHAARDVRVQVLRVGWYGGSGARTVWTSPPVDVRASPEPRVVRHTVPAAAFRTTVTATVPRTWVPGLYLAEAVVAGRPSALAGFVVRNDARPSSLVEVDSNLTWAAYGMAGGASLYRGPVPRGATHAQAVAARAYTVSLLRPTLATGLSQLTAYDLPLARLVDRLGLPVDHVLDTDLELRPSVLRGHVGVLIPGHAEYWTTRGVDALQAAEQHGINVADLGANALYWHARVVRDVAGVPVAMTVYRSTALDPLTGPQQATVRWQDPPLSRPSAALVGEAYAASFATGGLVLHRPPGWLVAGAHLPDGTPLPQAVLNEADGAWAGDTAAPPDVQVVAEGVLRGRSDVVVSTSYASLPSGAALFDAGTTTWLCSLDDSCPEGPVPASTSHALLVMTTNVLHAFAQPRWGHAHPARHDVPGSAAALLPHLPAVAVGRHGRED